MQFTSNGLTVTAVQYDGTNIADIEALGLVETPVDDPGMTYIGYPKPADAEFPVIYALYVGQYVVLAEGVNSFQILTAEEFAAQYPPDPDTPPTTVQETP